ncbi:helix-turn-helix domain-containing protein [Pontibacter fetidus]|uniref:AraC family transcriptional regulator n=1 Tax=Pontibacter fetidus TaxID=2700082 RepID=A0A6B2GY99_9BACT|nr:helix-turn-helix domain-containing protein [Pontibacter fetidus]NDK54971.1 AraC family transcriptional regulator [Pontibacter fetidus]
MQTKFYTPHILLQEFVNCIMVIHAEVGPTSSACPYPPAPQNSLFFYINDRIKVKKEGTTEFVEQPRSVIVGPQVSRVMLDINRSHKAVRVGFHPGGLHRFMGIPMCEMIDSHFDATDVYGNEMALVNERLQEAQSFDEIKIVIEEFLLSKVKTLKQALPFDRAMLELMRHNGNAPIEQISSLACLSLRQFERVSKERIGLTPKFFARLVRFSKAYRMHENYPELSWTHISYSCGYFDQMHFIRDFKQFAGVAPGTIEKDLQKAPVRLQAELRL